MSTPAALRCKTGNQDTLNTQGPQISYVTINKANGNAQGDVICKFAFPVSMIWVSSKTGAHASDSLYLHLAKLNKVYTTGAIAPDGSEQWFNMSYSLAGGTLYRGCLLKFHEPVQTVYLELGNETAGSGYVVTLAGSNDIEDLSAYAPGLGPL